MGVRRRRLDVAGIGQRRRAPDFHLGPCLGSVEALEQSHPRSEKDGRRLHGAHRHGVDVQHPLGIGVAQNAALQMIALGKLQQRFGTIFPGIAPVETADHPADFETGIHCLGLLRARGQGDDPAREAHLDHHVRKIDAQPLPMLAGVHAAIHRGRRGSAVHDPRVIGPEQQRPDHYVGVGKIQGLPVLASVRTAVWPMLRAHIDDPRVVRMDENRPNFGLFRQTATQHLPVGLADRLPTQAADRRGIPVAGELRGARVHVLRHVPPPVSRPGFRLLRQAEATMQPDR